VPSSQAATSTAPITGTSFNSSVMICVSPARRMPDRLMSVNSHRKPIATSAGSGPLSPSRGMTIERLLTAATASVAFAV
jgi:hypothetical protein